MDKKAILQIGTATHAEYLPLVDPSLYSHALCGALPIDFPELHRNQWKYFGVDMCGFAVNRCKEKFATHPDVTFLQECVYDGSEVRHDDFTIGLGEIAVKSITLDTLLDIIPAYVSLLAIDVEGSEIILLNAYSWKHKPRIVIIEMHDADEVDAIHELMHQQGYVIEAVGYQFHCLNVAYVREKPNSISQRRRIRIHIEGAKL